MCGRFAQHYTWAQVNEFLSIIGAPQNLQPHYNIAPTTLVDMVRHNAEGQRELVRGVRCGLIPNWWKKPLRTFPPRLTRELRRSMKSRCFAAHIGAAAALCRPRDFTNGRGRRASSRRTYLSLRTAHRSGLPRAELSGAAPIFPDGALCGGKPNSPRADHRGKTGLDNVFLRGLRPWLDRKIIGAVRIAAQI